MPHTKEQKRLYDIEYSKKNAEKIKERNKKYREENKEAKRIRDKEYAAKNREKKKLYDKEYREKNAEAKRNRDKKYYEKNKDIIRLKTKVYRENNKENRNKYEKVRKETDSLYKLTCDIRTLIGQTLRKNGFKKNTKTAMILGCSFLEFKSHLESLFEPWMNWNNRALYNGKPKFGWDIDHIIPVSSARTEEEIIRLNHYTNLKPLCSYTNRYIKKAIL